MAGRTNLNEDEECVLALIARQNPGQGVSIAELARECFKDPTGSSHSKGNSRARNALRRLKARDLIVQLGSGLYGAGTGKPPQPGLRASWLQEGIPLDPSALAEQPDLTTLAGHLAESVVGATLSTIHGLDLAWLPERSGEPEVDFILTSGIQRIPIEVKYQRRLDPLRDTEGLRTFIEKAINRAPFGILVTQLDEHPVLDPRIVPLPLSSLMLLR